MEPAINVDMGWRVRGQGAEEGEAPCVFTYPCINIQAGWDQEVISQPLFVR